MCSFGRLCTDQDEAPQPETDSSLTPPLHFYTFKCFIFQKILKYFCHILTQGREMALMSNTLRYTLLLKCFNYNWFKGNNQLDYENNCVTTF